MLKNSEVLLDKIQACDSELTIRIIRHFRKVQKITFRWLYDWNPKSCCSTEMILPSSLSRRGNLGCWSCIPAVPEAGMCKNLALGFGMDTNADLGFGGFQTWVQRWMKGDLRSTNIFIFFWKIPLSLTAMQLSFIIIQAGRLPWSCDRVRRPCGPHHFILTTMLVHRCESPHGVELTYGPRAKKHLTHLLLGHN